MANNIGHHAKSTARMESEDKKIQKTVKISLSDRHNSTQAFYYIDQDFLTLEVTTETY